MLRMTEDVERKWDVLTCAVDDGRWFIGSSEGQAYIEISTSATYIDDLALLFEKSVWIIDLRDGGYTVVFMDGTALDLPEDDARRDDYRCFADDFGMEHAVVGGEDSMAMEAAMDELRERDARRAAEAIAGATTEQD